MNNKETVIIEVNIESTFISCFDISALEGSLICPKTVGSYVSITLVLRSMQESGTKLSAVLEKDHQENS